MKNLINKMSPKSKSRKCVFLGFNPALEARLASKIQDLEAGFGRHGFTVIKLPTEVSQKSKSRLDLKQVRETMAKAGVCVLIVEESNGAGQDGGEMIVMLSVAVELGLVVACVSLLETFYTPPAIVQAVQSLGGNIYNQFINF